MAIKKYIETFSIDDWEREITVLRKYNEKHLKIKSANMGGYAEINHWRTDRLSTYHIHLKEGNYDGNYQNCLDYMEQVKWERKQKERYW